VKVTCSRRYYYLLMLIIIISYTRAKVGYKSLYIRNVKSNIMRLLVFDVFGYAGHFRRIDSPQNFLLSYFFPPRTTLEGLIAGIMGYPRDSYYELFGTEKCDIGLQIMRLVRKIEETLVSDGMEIKKEIVVADNGGELQYRVFFHHIDEKIQNELERRVKEKSFVYPPYLGTSEMLASIEYVETVDADYKKSRRYLPITTLIRVGGMKNFKHEHGLSLIIETNVPADFEKERVLKRKETYMFESALKPIKTLLTIPAFKYREAYGAFL